MWQAAQCSAQVLERQALTDILAMLGWGDREVRPGTEMRAGHCGASLPLRRTSYVLQVVLHEHPDGRWLLLGSFDCMGYHAFLLLLEDIRILIDGLDARTFFLSALWKALMSKP